ncbi:hypothetical protein RFI_32389, partial [Reticulomyxa filosa]
MEVTKQKLKDYYKTQDKLVPLFDDPQQSVDTCYVRLAFVSQQFQEEKVNIPNKWSDNEKKEDDEKWPNKLNYSLINDDDQKIRELQDIWKIEENGLETHHISIYGEAGSGKSVLTQRITYLWATNQMWNDRFEWNKNNDIIKMQWSKIINELHIPQWNIDDTNIVYSQNGLLVLDGFDEIANELNKKPDLKQWLQHCT